MTDNILSSSEINIDNLFFHKNLLSNPSLIIPEFGPDATVEFVTNRTQQIEEKLLEKFAPQLSLAKQTGKRVTIERTVGWQTPRLAGLTLEEATLAILRGVDQAYCFFVTFAADSRAGFVKQIDYTDSESFFEDLTFPPLDERYLAV